PTAASARWTGGGRQAACARDDRCRFGDAPDDRDARARSRAFAGALRARIPGIARPRAASVSAGTPPRAPPPAARGDEWRPRGHGAGKAHLGMPASPSPPLRAHLQPRHKLWLNWNGAFLMGPRYLRFLEAVEDTGTIRAAGRAVGWSYRTCLNRIRAMERVL